MQLYFTIIKTLKKNLETIYKKKETNVYACVCSYSLTVRIFLCLQVTKTVLTHWNWICFKWEGLSLLSVLLYNSEVFWLQEQVAPELKWSHQLDVSLSSFPGPTSLVEVASNPLSVIVEIRCPPLNQPLWSIEPRPHGLRVSRGEFQSEN